jgi:hypothetical protein
MATGRHLKMKEARQRLLAKGFKYAEVVIKKSDWLLLREKLSANHVPSWQMFVTSFVNAYMHDSPAAKKIVDEYVRGHNVSKRKATDAPVISRTEYDDIFDEIDQAGTLED